MASIPAIAVDGMGGDFAPEPVVGGVALALAELGDRVRICLVGDRERLMPLLEKYNLAGHSCLEVVNAPEVIGMDEHPASAVRTKRKSSINVAADLVKAGDCAGLFTAGNTGAAVAATFLKWRMLQGIERPAIAAALPKTDGGRFLLLDAGATVDCTPRNLAQFAIMGDIFAKLILGMAVPNVGLLSNGTEPGKGNRLTQESFSLLREINCLSFRGNVEGHDLFSPEVDVVVCDGFVGNVVLKTSESLAKAIGKMVKEQICSKAIWKAGGLLCKGAFEVIKKSSDASEVGGAPLLGVRGTCLIGHGRADAKAVCNGIKGVLNIIDTQVNEHIVEQIHEYGLDGVLA